MKVIEAVLVSSVICTVAFLMIYFLDDCKPLDQKSGDLTLQVRCIALVFMESHF